MDLPNPRANTWLDPTARQALHKIAHQARSVLTRHQDPKWSGVQDPMHGSPKDFRRPSPLIAQQAEELPFRVELGGSAELGQHLARNAVDTHAGPLRAL